MKKEFYESFCGLTLFFSIVILGICSVLFLCADDLHIQFKTGVVLYILVVFLFGAFMAKHLKKTYIAIDPIKIEYDKKEIFWSQIKEIYLDSDKGSRMEFPKLILRTDDKRYIVNLLSMSDKTRRSLFDAISVHHKIDYGKFQYEKDYMLQLHVSAGSVIVIMLTTIAVCYIKDVLTQK